MLSVFDTSVLIAALLESHAVHDVARPRITPGQARHLIDENILQVARVVTLQAEDYTSALQRMTRLVIL